MGMNQDELETEEMVIRLRAVVQVNRKYFPVKFAAETPKLFIQWERRTYTPTDRYTAAMLPTLAARGSRRKLWRLYSTAGHVNSETTQAFPGNVLPN